jgi:hypothetical protein
MVVIDQLAQFTGIRAAETLFSALRRFWSASHDRSGFYLWLTLKSNLPNNLVTMFADFGLRPAKTENAAAIKMHCAVFLTASFKKV